MLGRKDRSEKMFYYVKIDDLIPEDHLLRLIHRHVDLGFIRRKVAHLYSHTGRPSIDPEVLLEDAPHRLSLRHYLGTEIM